RIVFGRIDMTIEEMRHPPLLRPRWPRRDDGEITIDLHRIGVDDDAAKLFGEPDRKRRFAARGRPSEEDGTGFGHGGFLLARFMPVILGYNLRRGSSYH